MKRHLFIERKTKKFSFAKKAARTLFAALALPAAFAFFACDDAGLGESIDTTEPSVSIKSPESSAVISGAFKVTGTCFDDKAVASVVVTVTNTVTGEKIGTHVAAITGNDWTLDLNQPAEGKYPLADGTYSASAICYDAAGRQSGAASRVFEIDNTAPVFCITSPNSLNINDPAAFGRSVKIKGEIADDHAIKQMDIRVFKYAEGAVTEITSSLAKSSFSGFETAGGTEVKIAQYYPDGQVPAPGSDEYPLYQNYMAMYSGATVGQTIKFYIFPFLTDIAGNTSANCYIQTQLKKLVSEACGVETTSDSLQTAQFKKMLNGSYNLGEVDVEKVKQILNGQYEQSSYNYLARMGKDDAGVDATNALLAMSVNANNSPMYEFGGFAVDTSKTGVALTEAAPGGQISVRISAGLDGTLVKPGSLKVYLWECDASLSLLDGQDIKNPDTAKYSSTKGQLTITTDGTTAIPSGAASVATGTYIVTLPMTLLGGNRYRVTASGEDDDGNELYSDNFYAFITTLSANAPSVDFNGQFFIKADAIMAPQAGQPAAPFYTATIKIDDRIQKTMDQKGEIKITPLLYKGYYASANDLKEGDYLKTPDWSGSQITIGHDKIVDISSGNGTYQASLDMNIFPLANYSAANYTVALKIVASNDVASSGEDIFLFWADNKKPELAITSPSANGKIYDTDKDCDAEKSTYTPRGTWSDLEGSGTYRLWWSTTDTAAPTFAYEPARAVGVTSDVYGDGVSVYYEKKAENAYIPRGVLGASDKVNDYYTLKVTSQTYIQASGTADGVTEYYERSGNGTTDNPYVYTSKGVLTAGTDVSSYYTLGKWTEAAGVSQTAAETQWSATIAGITESVGQKISVIAMDAAGNVSDLKTVSGLTYDFSEPTVALAGEPGGSNPVKVQAYYNGGDLKFTFTASDTLALPSGSAPIVVTAKKSGVAVTSGYSIVDVALAADKKSGSAAIKLASDGTSDGNWTFEVFAKDACGRVGKSTTIQTIVDCKAPELKDYDYDPANPSATTSKPIVIKGSGTTDGWYKDEALEISGKFFEADSGSGVDKIYYFLETPSMRKNISTAPYAIPSDLTVASSDVVVEKHRDYKTISEGVGIQFYKITPIGFEEISTDGEGNTLYNNLYIQAIDKAGNKSARRGPYQIQEDQGVPSVSTAFYTYDNDVLTVAAGSVMTNGKKPLTLYGKASDGLSGLKSLAFKIGSNPIAGATILYSTEEFSTANEYKTATYNELSSLDAKAVKSWKAVIPNSAFENGGGDFFVGASDLAGNEVEQKAFALVLDKTPPEIELVSPATIKYGASGTATSIYGAVTFKGTANDTSGLSSVSVEYSTDNTNWTELYKTDSDSAMYNWSADATGAKAVSAVSGSSYKMLGYGDNLYAGTAKDLYIRVTASDKAGNTVKTGDSEGIIYKYKIDPELDRPKIAIANAVLDDMTSAKHVWITGSGNNKIYGNIDDDKVTALSATFEFYDQNADSGNGAWVVLTDSTTPKAPALAFANGSFTISGFPDGKQRVTFAATKDGRTYTAHVGDVDNYIAPLLCGSGDNAKVKGRGKGDSLLYITIDTTPPVLGERLFYVGSETTGSSTLGKLGGDRSKFTCKTSATDINGVKKISLRIKDAKNKSGQAITVEKSKERSESETSLGQVSLSDIDISQLASGTYTAEIVATDNAGLESVFTMQIAVDNDSPNVTVSVPAKENEVVMGVSTNVSGSTNEFGTTTTTGGQERAKVYYAVCPIGKSDTVKTLPPSFNAWYNVDTGADVSISPVSVGFQGFEYKQFDDAGVSWNLIFDGDFSASEGTHAKRLNDYLADYGIATAGNIAEGKFADIVRLHVWIKVVDEVGNVTEISRGLNVDPQGDRPKISFTYPEDHGKTVGSAVDITGDIIDNFHSDPKASDTAWIQIISKKEAAHGSYTYNTGHDPTNYNVTAADVKSWVSYAKNDGTTTKKLYNVYKIKDYVIGGSNTALTDETVASVTDETAKDYGILAAFDGSTWKLNLDFAAFSADDKTNEIAVRAYAYNGKLSSPSYRVMSFDKDAPEMSDRYLRQYSDAELTNESASRVYSDNIYVMDKDEDGHSADWYITFTLADTNGIKHVCFSDISLADAKSKVGADTEISKLPAKECVKRTVTEGGKTTYYYDIKHKLTRAATSSKETLYVYFDDAKEPAGTGHYTFIINHDNQNPYLAPSDSNLFNIKGPVCNSDLWYTLGSMAREDGNDQSGFARVVFYFKRDITSGVDAGKSKIFDPMYSKGHEDSYTFTDKLVLKEGLYWKQKTVTVTGSSIALGAKDPNIHIGGIVKFKGMIYTITGLSDDGMTVTINSATEYSGKELVAYFALGNVVDNKVQETESKSFKDNINWTAGYGNGYGKVDSSSPSAHDNDDGDRMIEKAVTTGSQTIWEAKIYSKNIPDGPIEICYTVYDVAGNYAKGSVTGVNVSNNAPRIANITVSTDYNGNDAIDEGESLTWFADSKLSWDKALTSITLHGGDKEAKATDSVYTSSYLTAKGKTVIKPEILGGNGALYYYYSYPSKDSSTTYVSGYNKTKPLMDSDAGREAQTASQSGDIIMQVGDLMKAWKGEGMYEFKIYDSTEETIGVPDATDGQAPTSQHADITLWMDNQVNDTTAPVDSKITPFYWNSVKDNSIYDSSEAEDASYLKGHIELPIDLPGSFTNDATDKEMDRDPKVSGKIVIRGEAFDAVRLDSLYITLPGFTGLTGLVDSGLTGTGGAKFYKMATFDAANNKWIDSDDNTNASGESAPITVAANGWRFNVESSKFDATGHYVTWALELDTNKYSATAPAATDVLIEFMSKDQGVPTCPVSSETKPEKYTGVDGTTKYAATEFKAGKTSDYTAAGGSYQMDIVPYVVKIYTNLGSAKKNNWSVYNRTTSGVYPVYTYKNSTTSTASMETGDSEVVQVYGFNLSGASGLLVLGENDVRQDKSADYDCYKFAAGALGGTGTQEVEFTVAGVSTLNNKNNNDAKGGYDKTTSKAEGDYSVYSNYYNRLPNDSNNNRLTDDIKFDVWQLNNSAAVPISNKIMDPVMKINPKSGKLGFAFENDPTYFSMPNGKAGETGERSYDYWAGCYDKITVPAFDYIYSDTDQGEVVALAQGNDISGANSDNFLFYYSKWGSRHDVGATGTQYNGFGLEQIGYKYGGKNYWDKSRFQGTSVVSAEKRVYLAYYDRVSSQIRFRSSLKKTVPDGIGKRKDESGYVKIDFGNIISRNERKDDHGIPDWSMPVPNAQVFAAASCSMSNVTTKYKPGEHLCLAAEFVDGASDDKVVIVWYDGTNCYYSCNMTPSTDRSPNGSGREINMFDGSSTGSGWSDAEKVFSGAGQYCKVAFDHNGGVHVAAYDAGKNRVCYAYSADATSPSFKTCYVDTKDAGGAYLTLDVSLAAAGGDPVPQIGYYSSACAKPVLAKYNGPNLRSATADDMAGVDKDGNLMTGVWEISPVPSSSVISKDRVNVALRKDASGVAIAPATGTSYYSNTAKGYSSSSYGVVYGLANTNAVMGYCRAVGAKTYIETAQRK